MSEHIFYIWTDRGQEVFVRARTGEDLDIAARELGYVDMPDMAREQDWDEEGEIHSVVVYDGDTRQHVVSALLPREIEVEEYRHLIPGCVR